MEIETIGDCAAKGRTSTILRLSVEANLFNSWRTFNSTDDVSAVILSSFGVVNCCACSSAAYNVGTLATPTVCGQTVYGDRRPHGLLMSPTYPGVYPDNLYCFYRLQGARGQRVRLTFIDLDLYSGGDQ